MDTTEKTAPPAPVNSNGFDSDDGARYEDAMKFWASLKRKKPIDQPGQVG
jgi:hypothetical protein